MTKFSQENFLFIVYILPIAVKQQTFLKMYEKL